MTLSIQSIRRYVKGKLRSDLSAGLTVGMVVIPQAMANAAIAGVNPLYGLYTAIIPTIFGAIFGSYPFLVTGPTNPTALVTAKNKKVKTPSRPSCFKSPSDPTPTKITAATNGMTTILSRLTNVVPSGSIPIAIDVSRGEPVRDAIIPSNKPPTRPIATAV